GKIVLVTSHRPPDWAATVLDDPHYGWGRWTAEPMELRTVPADHLGIFDDRNLEFVATQGRQAILETSSPRSEAMSGGFLVGDCGVSVVKSSKDASHLVARRLIGDEHR